MCVVLIRKESSKSRAEWRFPTSKQDSVWVAICGSGAGGGRAVSRDRTEELFEGKGAQVADAVSGGPGRQCMG
eukprot:15364935-Ditylum_brightwellii.AAC.3